MAGVVDYGVFELTLISSERYEVSSKSSCQLWSFLRIAYAVVGVYVPIRVPYDLPISISL